MKGFTKTSFITDCVNGYATVDDLDDYVEFWHNHETGASLSYYLGLSDDEYDKWLEMDDDNFFTALINKKKNDRRNMKTKCINGDLHIGDLVLSTPDDEYSCLIGRVTDNKLLRDPDRDTENETDDVYVNFLEMEYSTNRIKEIEEMFSDIYREPKTFEDCLMGGGL